MLRLATENDAEQIQAIYAPFVENTVISFELEPPSVEEMGRRINYTLVQMPWLVDERDSEIAGYVYASKHRDRAAYQWSVDVSAYVSDRYRRLGIARNLYTTLFKLLALQGYYNAYAGIALPNPASVGLHEAVGFRPIGVYRKVGYKLGAWHDVGWWHLSLQEPAVPPTLPQPLPFIQNTTEFRVALNR